MSDLLVILVIEDDEAIQSLVGEALSDGGFHGTFRVMQSNGGVMSAETAKKMPVTMMESGPVAGVIAAAHLGENGRLVAERQFDRQQVLPRFVTELLDLVRNSPRATQKARST